MLGEADRVVSEVVGQAGLRGNLAQHLVIEVAAEPDHPLFDLRLVANRRKIKERYFHSSLDFSRDLSQIRRYGCERRFRAPLLRAATVRRIGSDGQAGTSRVALRKRRGPFTNGLQNLSPLKWGTMSA